MTESSFIVFQMSGSSGTPPNDDWICNVCHQTPVDSLSLEYQLISTDNVILVDKLCNDIVKKEWLRCQSCDRRFHLCCVDNLPSGVKEEDFEWQCYLCEHCGWFMSGAYSK